MKQSSWLLASRRDPVAAGIDGDDALYEGALAALLAQAVQPPGVLDRLRRTIWSALKALHTRRRDDGDSLPPEYWYGSW